MTTSLASDPRARVDDERTTVSEDQESEAVAAVIALRAAVPGITARSISQRLGLHIATVRKYLGRPDCRAAVAEAKAAALDGADLVLSEHAEELAETIAMLGTTGPDGPLDAIKLKAAEVGLKQLRGEVKEAKTAAAAAIGAAVGASMSPEERAKAYALFTDRYTQPARGADPTAWDDPREVPICSACRKPVVGGKCDCENGR